MLGLILLLKLTEISTIRNEKKTFFAQTYKEVCCFFLLLNMFSLPAFLEVTFVSGCLHLLEHLAELEEVGGPAMGLLLTLGAPS